MYSVSVALYDAKRLVLHYVMHNVLSRYMMQNVSVTYNTAQR